VSFKQVLSAQAGATHFHGLKLTAILQSAPKLTAIGGIYLSPHPLIYSWIEAAQHKTEQFLRSQTVLSITVNKYTTELRDENFT
jgi:hypothetical protein